MADKYDEERGLISDLIHTAGAYSAAVQNLQAAEEKHGRESPEYKAAGRVFYDDWLAMRAAMDALDRTEL